MEPPSIYDLKDFHNVIRLLEHPEWQADLRRVLLSKDFLSLPEQVFRIARCWRESKGTSRRVSPNDAGAANVNVTTTLGSGSTIDAGGGTGNVSITASTESCQWRAQIHVPWITLTSAVTGNGNGTVAYSAPVNPGGPRKGRITVNGKRVTITQN